MLQIAEDKFNEVEVSKALREWRDAANAWSELSRTLEKNTSSKSSEKEKQQLRMLEQRLNRASEKYLSVRLGIKAMELDAA